MKQRGDGDGMASPKGSPRRRRPRSEGNNQSGRKSKNLKFADVRVDDYKLIPYLDEDEQPERFEKPEEDAIPGLAMDGHEWGTRSSWFGTGEGGWRRQRLSGRERVGFHAPSMSASHSCTPFSRESAQLRYRR